jgi:hypothetical protein
MLNGRIYRAAFAPFLVVLGVVAFSLTPRPGPLTSTLAPDAFEGKPAFAELKRLSGEFPDRRPGSLGDQRLAERVAGTIRGLGGTAGGGFSVLLRRVRAQTIEGEETLQTVIAQRPGSTGESPIVILAHRDAAQPGSVAELSGTAALLELSRVFASRETRRSIVLVSTSGGSGGDAGAADFAAHASGLVHGEVDAAIVLGDVASTQANPPVVVPYSDGYGSAPDELQRTVSGAILHESGLRPGAPSALGQLAHLAFGFAPGEQGALGASGIPAVLVQVSGEEGPSVRPPAPPRARGGPQRGAPQVSMERMEGIGRATLSAVDALDVAPAIETEAQRGIVLARQIVPAWALRLLIGSLLIPPLVVLVDGLARARRRLLPVGRWIGWALTCGLPFFLCALFVLALGTLGGLPGAPAVPVLPSGLPFDGATAVAVLACALALGLGWLAWPTLVRRLGLGVLPGGDAEAAGSAEAAGIVTLVVLLAVAIGVWTVNPYAALLIIPGLHLLLAVAAPDWRPRPLVGLGLLALSLLPLGLLIAFYAHQLGYGLGGVAWTAVLLVAGGHVGLVGVILWSVALGCGVAMALIAVTPPAELPGIGPDVHSEVTIRGPLSYAGPGSLGGTESALRR